jgi:hypothetical protein
MSQTLSEIVSSALRQADQSIKVASLREAPIEDRGFARVDDYLARELGQVHVEEQKIASAAPSQSAQVFSGYDDVDFAFKLAEALQHGAVVVEKLAAEGGMNRPLNKSDGGVPTPGGTPPAGPAPIQPPLYDRAVTATPMPQASAHARRAQANTRMESEGNPETDRGLQLNDGPVIPSNYPTSRLPTTGATTKKANLDRALTQRLLRSKIAQHKMLVSLGQVDAANAVLKEAAELAQTGAPHEQSALVYKDTYGGAGFPDNEQVRALTKAQARDANQREAGAFFGEPVKRDSAVLAHLAVAPGLKLSQLRVGGRDKEASWGSKAVQGVGKGLGWIGDKASRAGQGVMKGTADALENVSGPTSSALYTNSIRGRHALAGMTPSQKKVLGGAILGTGAVGTGVGVAGGRLTAPRSNQNGY